MGFFSALFGEKKNDVDPSFANACLKTPDLALRTLVDELYDGVWKSAKAKGWNDEQCIEAANIGALTRLYQAEAAFKIPVDKIAELSRWESAPFNRLPLNIAKSTFIEYVVWRQYPDKADMKLVMSAMNNLVSHLKETGGENDELLNGFRSDPFFSWLPWRKLIS